MFQRVYNSKRFERKKKNRNKKNLISFCSLQSINNNIKNKIKEKYFRDLCFK